MQTPLEKKMKLKNDLAVSPVIGVILMVAITVILAAVIAAFVFGSSMSVIPKNKIISVSVQQPNPDNIVVTYTGGVDTYAFNYATVNVTDDDGKFMEVDDLTSDVGNSVIATGKFSGRNHVVVVGYFYDNSAQVLLDTYV